MSIEEKTSLPTHFLDKNKKIVALNSEHKIIFESIDTELKKDKYNSIVTMQNFPDMKASATELNGTATFINKFKIEKVKSETVEIKEFEENCKKYCELIQGKREEIKKGLEIFQEETRKQVVEVCKSYLEECLDELNIRNEFRTITVDDMTATGFMTATGNISKKGKDEIIKRVNVQNNLQTKVDNRVLSLENVCLKAGVEPLTVEHIQGFLYEEDDAYTERLNSLINAEIARNNRVKEQAELEAQKKAKEKIEQEQKAEKDELHARYESRIKTAQKDDLLIIGVELQSYSGIATYELKQMIGLRQEEIESETVEKIDDTLQNQHLKDIAQEPIKKECPYPTHGANEELTKQLKKEEAKVVDGKIGRILSIKITVPEKATEEQVVRAVIKMIKEDRFPIENIEVV